MTDPIINYDFDIPQTSVYLTKEDRKLVKELMIRTGLNRSGVIRLALHRLHSEGDEERNARLLEIAEEIRRLA